MNHNKCLFEDVTDLIRQNKQSTEPTHLAWLVRGILLAKLGRYEEAINSYRQALEIEPVNPDILYHQGIALISLGKRQKAIATFEKIINIEPNYHKAWREVAFLLFALEHLEQAIDAWDQALEIEPDDSQSWYKRGIALSRLKRFADAIHSYTKALEFQPNHRQAKSNRDLLFRYLKGIEFQSEDHITWFNMGIESYQAERYEEALEFWQISLKIKEDFPKAWFCQGATLSRLELHREAINSYDRALSFNSDYPEAWEHRGISLLRLREYEESLSSLDNALRLNPNSHEILNTIGFVLSKLGRYKEAIVSYDQAISINPDFYKVWRNRGLAQYHLGNYHEAVANYDRALIINPNDEIVQKEKKSALQKLEQIKKLSSIDDDRLKKYAKLIRQVLTYSNEEEIKRVVIDNSDLIDASFLFVLKQSIEVYSDRGDEESVKKLKYFRPLISQALREMVLKQEELNTTIINQDNSVQSSLENNADSQTELKTIRKKQSRHKNKKYRSRLIFLFLLIGTMILVVTLGRKLLFFIGIALLALMLLVVSCALVFVILNIFNRGIELYNQEKYQEALSFYDKFIRLIPRSSWAWLGRGRALRMLGRNEEALASYNKSLKLSPKNDRVWNNRGMLLHEMNLSEEAVESYNKALALKKESRYFTNRGNALLSLRQYQKAIDSYDKSLDNMPTNVSTWFERKGATLTWLNRGKALILLENYEEAIHSFDKALGFERGIEELINQSDISYSDPDEIYHGNMEEQSRYLIAKSMKELARGKLADAQGNIEQAIKHYFQSSFHVDIFYEIEPRRKWRDKFFESSIISNFFCLVNALVKADRLEEALEIAEKTKGRKLITQFADFTNKPFRSTPYQGQMTELGELMNSMGDMLNDMYNMPYENELNIQKIISLKEIKDLVPDQKTVLIEWFVTDKAVHAFVITKNSYVGRFIKVFSIDQLRTKELYDWFTNYDMSYADLRECRLNSEDLNLKEKRWDKDLFLQLQMLSDLLRINDILDYITLAAPDSNTIILVPHLFLHLLPLHALPIGNEDKILLDYFSGGIRRFPSCLLLKNLQERIDRWDAFFNIGEYDHSNNKTFKTLLAFQNPTTNLSEFPNLKYSDIEVGTIQNLFSNSLVFAEDKATKEKIHFPFPMNCVHFACHGYFSYMNPMESSLLLANRQRLTMTDITRRSLLECYLVTLSACESGLTDVTKFTDEYVGLPSAFLVAGARAVVCSLWLVDDLSTALLTIRFYENLTNLLSVHLALSEAQQWLRKATTADLIEWIETLPLESDVVLRLVADLLKRNNNFNDIPFANPYYWAAFCAIC